MADLLRESIQVLEVGEHGVGFPLAIGSGDEAHDARRDPDFCLEIEEKVGPSKVGSWTLQAEVGVLSQLERGWLSRSF